MNTASIMHSYMEYGPRIKYAWLDWVLKQGGDILKNAALLRMLHVAMEDHDLDMIRALLDHGCDVDVHLESGHTCLSFAVGHRDLELTKILLEAGADPNKAVPDADNLDYTPFDRAIIGLQDGLDTEVVDLLLATGRCRINKGRDPESTAFSFVLGKAQEWAPGVADSLAIRMIDSVANLEEDRDQIGCTLLHTVVHHQREDFVDLLLSRGLDIDATGDAGYTPFIQACQYSPKMVPGLVDRGANVHTRYKSHASALHAAAAEGTIETLSYLLGIGMDIEDCTAKGYTPLACALTWAQEAAALELLKRGASVTWKTLERHQTALHFAARHGLTKVVDQLLKTDMDVNALDVKGWSPLHEV
jgi:ankyrin repeat protein